MGKYKYLAKNIGLLTASNFTSKILVFFLVPLYTSYLSTAEYGIYDLLNNSINLLIPILTINIQESVLRFALEKEKKTRSQIISVGVILLIMSSLFIICISAINYKLNLIGIVKDYPVYFVLLYFGTAAYQLFSNFARGVDKVKEVAIASVISSVICIGLNIYLLIYADAGLEGYLIASIASTIIPSIYLILCIRDKASFTLYINHLLVKELIAYSAPLILNAIGWWVNNAADRYVVTTMCGVAANGIYAVGYKIPSILNVFQTIFNQAWVLSSVKEFDPEDKHGFFGKTYNVYNAMMVNLCAIIIILSRPIARILYANDFFTAWQYTPFLTISIVFGAASGLLGGVFSAVKDSKIFGLSTIVGATVNLGLNFILVSKIGVIGAAIATTCSYALVWTIRIVSVKKYMKIRLMLKRDVVSYILLVCLSIILLLLREGFAFYGISLLILFFITILYATEIKTVFERVKGVVLVKRGD